MLGMQSRRCAKQVARTEQDHRGRVHPQEAALDFLNTYINK